MKIVAALVVLIGAVPAIAQSPQPQLDIREVAIAHVTDAVRCVHHEIPRGSFAIDDRPVAGAEKSFGEFAEEFFGAVISEELIRSHGENDATFVRWPASRVSTIPVLPLEEFSFGDRSYNWDRMNAKYPAIQRVVRVSPPALDRLSTYAIIRYEIIGPEGPHWAGLHKFERQSNGAWKATIAQVGDMWD